MIVQMRGRSGDIAVFRERGCDSGRVRLEAAMLGRSRRAGKYGGVEPEVRRNA